MVKARLEVTFIVQGAIPDIMDEDEGKAAVFDEVEDYIKQIDLPLGMNSRNVSLEYKGMTSHRWKSSESVRDEDVWD